MFINRRLYNSVLQALNTMPAVAIFGARQVGKTTLALQIASAFQKPSVYLDLELESDLAKLNEPEIFLNHCKGKLLIIDEVQRRPELFALLRGNIDSRIRNDERTAQFLILGSASWELLRQSSESLAGRIRYLELCPFSILETVDDQSKNANLKRLWLRGGFPQSYLANNDEDSWSWRSDFTMTFLERDIPLMGSHIPPVVLRNLWSMLAWENAQLINYSKLATNLAVNYKTVQSYISLLQLHLMVRELHPWSGNTRKRLIKSPRIFLRDSGIAHRLLRITSFDDLLGHPAVGASWEAFVVENLLRTVSDKWEVSFYRTQAGAEIDLVMEGPQQNVRAIEIKRSMSPKLSRGFHEGCKDVRATEKYVAYSGSDRFPLANDIEAIGVVELLKQLQE